MRVTLLHWLEVRAAHTLDPGQKHAAAGALVIGDARVGVGAEVEAQRDGGGNVVLADEVIHEHFVTCCNKATR